MTYSFTYGFEQRADILELCGECDAFPLQHSDSLAGFLSAAALLVQGNLNLLQNNTDSFTVCVSTIFNEMKGMLF